MCFSISNSAVALIKTEACISNIYLVLGDPADLTELVWYFQPCPSISHFCVSSYNGYQFNEGNVYVLSLVDLRPA